MTASFLGYATAQIIHHQTIAAIAETLSQQLAELLQAQLVPVETPHHQTVVAGPAMQLGQGHAFASHPLGPHEAVATRPAKDIFLGPEVVAGVCRHSRGWHCQAVQHHHQAGHAAIGEVGLGFKILG